MCSLRMDSTVLFAYSRAYPKGVRRNGYDWDTRHSEKFYLEYKTRAVLSSGHRVCKRPHRKL